MMGSAIADRRRAGAPLVEVRRERRSVGDCCEVAQLHALAAAVGRLTPSHRDPERFHMDKAEIVGELRRLARSMGE